MTNVNLNEEIFSLAEESGLDVVNILINSKYFFRFAIPPVVPLIEAINHWADIMGLPPLTCVYWGSLLIKPTDSYEDLGLDWDDYITANTIGGATIH